MLLLSASVLSAQVFKLSVVDLDAFPDTIVAGQPYDLSVDIINSGNTNIPAPVSILLSINGDTPTYLDQNVSSGVMEPGDTLHWNVDDYIFNSARFGGGGVSNGIIVWPTALNVVSPDSGTTDVIFVNTGGFKVSNTLIHGLPSLVDFNAFYAVNFKTVNLDNSPNQRPVEFLVQLDDKTPVQITSVNGTIPVGDTATAQLGNFNLAVLYGDEIEQDSNFITEAHTIYIWAMEQGKNNWVEFALYTVSSNLPVELGDLRAVTNENSIDLNWITTHEENNNYFYLSKLDEQSNEFVEIGQKKGQVYSATATEYTLKDRFPIKGSNYYRLGQIDLNGTNRLIGSIEVLYEPGISAGVVSVYPNPFETELYLVIKSEVETSADFSIYDFAGRVVYQSRQPVTGGISQINVDLPSTIAPGIYHYRLSIEGENLSGSLIRK